MELLDWQKQRTLAIVTIAIAGLSSINLFGISQMLQPLMDYIIVGDIKVGTVIGIATVIIAYMIYKKRIG